MAIALSKCLFKCFLNAFNLLIDFIFFRNCVIGLARPSVRLSAHSSVGLPIPYGS